MYPDLGFVGLVEPGRHTGVDRDPFAKINSASAARFTSAADSRIENVAACQPAYTLQPLPPSVSAQLSKYVTLPCWLLRMPATKRLGLLSQ